MAVPGQEEQLSQNSSDSKGFFELESSAQLERGQNFFDQPPFRQIITQVSSQTDIAEDNIRRLLRSFAQQGVDKNIPDKTMVNMTSQELYLNGKNIRSRVVASSIRGKSEPGKTEDYRKAVTLLAQRLFDYPLWHDYVVSQCLKTAGYQSDGMFIEKGYFPHLPQTYAKWVTNRLKNDERQKLLGIVETSPEGFSPTSSHKTPPNPSGESREHRRWIILKASELVRSKSR